MAASNNCTIVHANRSRACVAHEYIKKGIDYSHVVSEVCGIDAIRHVPRLLIPSGDYHCYNAIRYVPIALDVQIKILFRTHRYIKCFHVYRSRLARNRIHLWIPQ